MNGYMIHHETQINRQAYAIKQLANDYLNLITEIYEQTRLEGWDSPAAQAQKAKIDAALRDAGTTARSLSAIGSDLYSFTATHKTWLEDVVEAVTDVFT